MRNKTLRLLTTLSFISLFFTPALQAQAPSNDSSSTGNCAMWLDHSIGKLHSKEVIDLCGLTAGKPVLIVNTASFCGFTPQFKGLEALHQEYKDQGLVVIGFPSNDFFQEAEDESEIADVCYINYGVTFSMTEEVKVLGRNAHPVFSHLEAAGEPGWNFNKYLISKEGEIVEHFGRTTKPGSARMRSAIEQVL